MLPLILIAILSVSLIEGLDPYKGLLFSYYFYVFNKVWESYLVPIVSGLLYYSLGFFLTILLVNFDYTQSLRLIISYLLITHSLFKLFLGRIMHYTGNMRPSIPNVVKWSFLNSIIQMNATLLIGLWMLSKLSFVIVINTVIIVREIALYFSIKNSNLLLTLTRYNLDYIYVVLVLLVAILVLL
ncbi:hypothetical protein [Metallosphaera sp.]|uniref:hypothetical protein n=1 Tax=Metallosphaera sp. TaxID=2020860 RepID=UPI0031648CF8